MGLIASIRLNLLLILAVALAMAAVSVRAGDALPSDDQKSSILHEALVSYDRGIDLLPMDPPSAQPHFVDAAQRFQLLVDSGIKNGALLYNLGNAYFQAGDLGRAIANYRLAEQLTPGDARLQFNLAAARAACRTQIASTSDRSWRNALLTLQRIPLTTRFNTFLVVHVLFWITVGLFLNRRGIRLVLLPILLVWTALGVSIAADVAGVGRSPVGVIVANDVVVRKGNGAGFEAQFQQPLHAGFEFTLLERRGDWLLIEPAAEQQGWIEAKDAVIVD